MSIPKRIKYKLKIYPANILIRLSLLINSPFLTALGFLMVASRVNNSGDYKVLCLGRSIFTDDVAALAHFGQGIKYFVIHLKYWYIIFNHFTDEQERKNLTEQNYHTHNFCQSGKQKYYLYLQKMLPILRKLIGFDAILSGHIGYVVQQEIASLCQNTHLPFIALHKEAIVPSGVYKKFINNYKTNRFTGAKVLFYNQQCRQGFLNLNLRGVNKNNTLVTGIPRFDFYFSVPHKKTASVSQKQVVFFSFLPRYSFRFIDLNEEDLTKIDKRGLEFFKYVMEFARKHQDIKVIIKTKVSDQYFNYPKKIFEDYFKDKAIPNLIITNAGNPSDYIHQSMAIIGFNSTTLIEAIISGKIALSPYFGDITPHEPWTIFDKYPELINYVRSQDDLEKYIFNSQQYLGYNSKIKDEFLKEYISTSQGGASLQVEKVIIETIREYSNFDL